MANKQKFYVVWKGRRTGIFDTWAQAEPQVKGFQGADHKSFDTRAKAEAAWRQGHVARGQYVPSDVKPVARWKQARLLGIEPPILPSYCADAACSGNPGKLEYRAGNTETGELLFERKFPEGTNNIGEFLGIVEALMLLREQRDGAPIYTDSVNAIAWVKAKQCKTQLLKSTHNRTLFEHIARAEQWLRVHTYPNTILKWRTEDWGEIPADYGRK